VGPTVEEVKQANATKSNLTDILLPTSPDSVAVSLATVPSDFSLYPPHKKWRSESPARLSSGTPARLSSGTHRRALLCVILILFVWPLAQLATLYDVKLEKHFVATRLPFPFSRPPQVWTWPATFPRNVKRASKTLGAVGKVTLTALGLATEPRDLVSLWIASMALSNQVASEARAAKKAVDGRAGNTKALRLRVGPELFLALDGSFGLFG